MNFTTELTKKIEQCNAWLRELAPTGDGYHRVIYNAMNYSVSAGGKRIRPALALAVCEMFDGDSDELKHFACAIEFIHTYSLIHDDLPCMDDDDMRRGRPTNHKVYGDALAVLAGDALLNYAFEVALQSSSDKTVRLLRLIANASGTNGMIGGQVIDMKHDDPSQSAVSDDAAMAYDELLTLHKMKTGALISLSAAVGAVIGNANDTEMSHIVQFAENLGLAFQVRDDILDVEGSTELLGKKTGSDTNREKTTFVSLLGMEESKKQLTEFTNKAKSALDMFGDKAEFLRCFADYLLEREN